MTDFSRLGLGTVQFGLAYGVSNVHGQLPVAEIKRIIARAVEVGVLVLDTAAAYGESERVLGDCLQGCEDFRIITKTVPLQQSKVGKSEFRKVVEVFESSLTKLKKSEVDTLMAHHAEDLLVPGGENIFFKMQEWKANGKIKKLGVSVYDSEQIDRLFSRYSFDVVQLPISVYDQRLVQDGSVQRLAAAGVEIHARSIFLQGILLMPANRLPSHFAKFMAHHERYLSLLKHAEVSPVVAALASVTKRPEIALAVIGISSSSDFDECISAFSTSTDIDLSEFAIADKQVIDPRYWPRLPL
jgi:aryl-alcohol dehydrogenase-like predicted oxidoreductase